ncbi:MAG TPA: Rho termination factor N-terminal domain-containing protein, partial [Rugosimonospora sp.]|nr:Rho termination factor N-terminal domain-containing protein [Rugosimonospora sp.]
MSDTTDVTSDVSSVQAPEEAAGSARRRRTGSGLTAMLLPELQSMASSLGISGTARMRKGELIAAIQERQAGDGRVPGPRGTDAPREVPARGDSPRGEVRAEVRDGDRQNGHDGATQLALVESAGEATQAPSRRATRPAGPPEPRDNAAERGTGERTERAERDG